MHIYNTHEKDSDPMRFILTLLASFTLALSAGAVCAAADNTASTVRATATAQHTALTDRDISGCKVSFKYASYSYTGSPITPDNRNGADEITVTLGGKLLKKGTDYRLTYSNNVNVGYKAARLKVTGIGSYTGSKEVLFTIKPAKAAISSLTTENDKIIVRWGKVSNALGYQILYTKDPAFEKDVHSTTVIGRYYVNLTNIPKAGEKYYVKVRAFITSSGTLGSTRYGSYSSKRSITVKGNVKKATIPYLNYTYKGSRITPPVTVKDTLGNKLVNGRDFTVSYSNDLNVGTAKITVKGKGNYQGSISGTFNITPNDLADNRAAIPALSYIYVGEPVTPKPTLKFNGIKLTEGKDYTVSYKNNNAAGTATVTLTGKGNFKGSTYREFTLRKPPAGTYRDGKTTYYSDSSGVVRYWVTNGIISYSENYLRPKLSSALKNAGLTADSSLHRVDLKSVSKGVSSRRITLKWDHSEDKSFSSYVIFRSSTDGNTWKKLKQVNRTSSTSDYSYTDDISGEDMRFFRYAIVGVSGKKCSQPAFEEGWVKVKLCIDPGHYIGAKSNGVYSEGTQMLLLGGKVSNELKGFKLDGTAFADVRVTRTGDGKTEKYADGIPFEGQYSYADDAYHDSLTYRGKYAESCDYFISLHTNATGSNSWNTPNVWGIYCFINHTAAAKRFDTALAYELGLAASKTIDPNGISVESRAPFRDYMVVSWDKPNGETNFSVNKGADSVGVPGVLIEQSFHTNPSVRDWFMNDSNLAKLGRAEAVAMLRHYGFPME